MMLEKTEVDSYQIHAYNVISTLYQAQAHIMKNAKHHAQVYK